MPSTNIGPRRLALMRLFSFDILFSPRFHLECACEGAILPRSDWAFLRRGTYGGTEAKAHHFATQFRQPNDCRPRKRYVWGTRQSRWLRTADGFAIRGTRRLAFNSRVYRFLKSSK